MITLLLSAAIQTAIYMTGFWTVSTRGSAALSYAVVSLFSGLLVPPAFFPPLLRRIAAFLPFRGLYDTPALLYTGAVTYRGAVLGLLHQIVWVVVLIGFGVLLSRRGTRKLEVAGG